MNELPLSQIPLEDIQKRIEDLRQIDLKSCDIEDLIPCVKDLIRCFPFINSYLPLRTVFRARKSTRTQAMETPFSNVKDLWYPPKDKIMCYGRLNDIGDTIFYCSSNQDTAILEVRPNEGDVITIIECELRGDKIPKAVSWGMVEYAYQAHPDGDMATVRKEFSATKEGEANYLAINDYLEEEFTKTVQAGDEYCYKSTIAVSRCLLRGALQSLNLPEGEPDLLNPDGISYESIAWQWGLNLALKPEAADRLYRVKNCRALIITEKTNDIYKWDLITESLSIDADGTINWDQASLYDNRGLFRSSQHDDVGAEEDFTMAIQEGAKGSAIYTSRGRARHNQGKYAEAEADYSIAINDDNSNPELFVSRGYMRYKQGNFAEAAIDFRQAVKLGFDGDLDGVIEFCERHS